MENREGRSLATNKPLVCYKIKVIESRKNTSGIPYLITDKGLFRLNLAIKLDALKAGVTYFVQTVNQKHSIIPIEVIDYVQANF